MEHPLAFDFQDKRRAIRMEWERRVCITQPVQTAGKSVNISVCGILLRLERHSPLRIGDVIAMEIFRSDGMATVQRSGRIVRFDRSGGNDLVGVDLI